MHAHAVGLVHRAHGLVVVDVALAQFVLGKHLGVVAKHFPHHPRFVGQERHFLLAMRGVQVPARLRVAIHLRDQAFPILKALADFRVQALGGIQPPTADPLRPVQAS
ncbi:hypothetical protein D3C78_1361190 [compost metagenome]